jgi:hypothetical protein
MGRWNKLTRRNHVPAPTERPAGREPAGSATIKTHHPTNKQVDTHQAAGNKSAESASQLFEATMGAPGLHM